MLLLDTEHKSQYLSHFLAVLLLQWFYSHLFGFLLIQSSKLVHFIFEVLQLVTSLRLARFLFGLRGGRKNVSPLTCSFYFYITKTCLYNFDPLKPHFYIVKLGFTGVCTIFLISAQIIDCGYPLEPPRRGGSNEYPQSMFWAEIWKISDFFLSENVQFLVVKFSIYLNGRVFVMFSSGSLRLFWCLWKSSRRWGAYAALQSTHWPLGHKTKVLWVVEHLQNCMKYTMKINGSL